MPPSGLRDNGWEPLTSIYDYINIAFANRKKNKLKYAKAKNTAHDWVSQCVPIPLRIQTDRVKKRDWVGKMKRELSYIQFFMDQSQWSTATTDLTRLQHMVLISACHGPFYSYTRPPLTPPRTPSSVLTGCGPQQINDIKMQSWIGHSTCSPPPPPLPNMFWDGCSSHFSVFEWIMNDIFVTQSSLHGWLTDA